MSQYPMSSDHQAQRRALLPAAIGTPCVLCGYTMEIGQALDLDHVVPRSLGGTHGEVRITHSYCNRSRGNRPNDVIGRHRVARPACVICGASFRPTYKGHRCCSIPCGRELRRINLASRPPHPAPHPEPVRAVVPAKASRRTPGHCGSCGAPCTTTCSDECRAEANALRSRNRYRAKVGLPPDYRPRRRTAMKPVS